MWPNASNMVYVPAFLAFHITVKIRLVVLNVFVRMRVQTYFANEVTSPKFLDTLPAYRGIRFVYCSLSVGNPQSLWCLLHLM